jgi:hypothetical protein
MLKQKIKDTIVRFSDRNAPIAGAINKDGGIHKFSISDETILNEIIDFREKLLANQKFINFVKAKPFGTALDFADILQIFPAASRLLNEDLSKSIFDYLGPDVKVDSAHLSVINLSNSADSIKNPSGIMHHDSCGHRLKLFFPINEQGNKMYPTSYVERSHNIKWKTYLNEVLADDQRIPTEVLEKFPNISDSEKIVTFGSGYIFDTNGIHSGCYHENEEPRMIIQFELSANKKYVPGKVGPSIFYLSNKSCDHLKKLGLLDNTLVTLDPINNCLKHGEKGHIDDLKLYDLIS